jgi:hypothetical protein
VASAPSARTGLTKAMSIMVLNALDFLLMAMSQYTVGTVGN